MEKSRYCFIFLLFLIIPLTSFAQKEVLHFHVISLPEYISGNSIQLAERDHSGMLWIVRRDGLYRYDGNEMLHFDLNSKPALPALPITKLQIDHRGNLWLGFHNGAAVFNLKTWTISPLFAKDWEKGLPEDKDISSIGCMKDGAVYFGTQSGKLYVVRQFDKLTDHEKASISLARQRKGKYNLHLVLDMSKGSGKNIFNTIMNIQEPLPNQIWMGTRTGMLVNLPVFNHGTSYGPPAYYKPEAVKGFPIANICYDSSGLCLFSAWSEGAFLANINELYAKRDKAAHSPYAPPRKGYVKHVPLPAGEPFNYFLPFYISGTKAAIIMGAMTKSTNIYTYNFSTGNWQLETPSSPVQFPGNKVNFISGQSSTTFVESSGGLTSLQFKQVPVTPLLNGFNSDNSIRSVYKDSDYLYIGSYKDRFIRYDIKTGRIRQISRMYVYSMIRWNADTLLLATEGDGLYWYQISTNRLSPIPLKIVGNKIDENKKPDIYTTVLCRVNNHLVLSGSYRGVHLVDPVKEIFYPVFKDSLSAVMQSVITNAIIPTNKKEQRHYLVATGSGTFKINIGNGQVKYFLNSGVKKKIKQTAANSLIHVKGQIWMGTSGLGVLMANSSGQLIPSSWLNKQLTSQMVYSMTCLEGYVLIGTDKGLNVLQLKDSSITHYTTYNGLPSNEFNLSAVFNNGHRVYLGTTNGLVSWNVKRTKSEKKKLSFHVGISKLKIVDRHNHSKYFYNRSYLPLDSQLITIPSEARYVSLTFKSPGQTESRLNYYYRLKEDEPWTELGARRIITFVKLPPGNYKLQFAARTPTGIWTEYSNKIPLIVNPAYYQTFWFKLLLVMVIAGIITFIFRFREAQKNKERNLRMKIAGDLHDEVGSSLTRIWHQAQTCLRFQNSSNDNINPANKTLKANQINSIAQTSRDALSMMSDMVWSIDARFDTVEELILRMRDYIFKLNNESETQIDFEVTNVPDNRKISQSVRQNLFLLFKEGINNAIKHGDGDFIGVRIQFNDKLVMKIENSYNANEQTGHGSRQGGRGLVIMQRRTENMQGELQFRQEEKTFILLVKV